MGAKIGPPRARPDQALWVPIHVPLVVRQGDLACRPDGLDRPYVNGLARLQTYCIQELSWFITADSWMYSPYISTTTKRLNYVIMMTSNRCVTCGMTVKYLFTEYGRDNFVLEICVGRTYASILNRKIVTRVQGSLSIVSPPAARCALGYPTTHHFRFCLKWHCIDFDWNTTGTLCLEDECRSSDGEFMFFSLFFSGYF